MNSSHLKRKNKSHISSYASVNDVQMNVKDELIQDSTPQEDSFQIGEYIKSLVYGGMDGLVTTFSVVAGVQGAKLDVSVILALGIANLIGDGLSMALGDYISSKSEGEFAINERKIGQNVKEKDFSTRPGVIQGQCNDLLVDRGMTFSEAESVTKELMVNEKAVIEILLDLQLGLLNVDANPFKNALVTFFSFSFFGLMPLLPFILGSIFEWENNYLFLASIILTASFLFILGVSKSFISSEKWLVAGIETLVVGSMAAAASYLIGMAFE